MTGETAAELRARFERLPAEMERLLEERAEREYSTGYETSGFYLFSRSSLDDLIEYAIALIDWGSIDGMLARLAAAEADADQLRLTVAGLQEQLVLLPEDLAPMTPEQLAQFNASRYRGRA